MATLVEGQEYGLTCSDISKGNKTVIHFKLTDSALNALEEISRSKGGVGPTIKFQGTKGAINIPSHVSSSGSRPERNFQVSLSALPKDVNGSFECVRQTSKNGQGSLQSFGTILHRVSVHATDDVYDRTRAKMTMVDEETKKVCTKEIKPSGRHISKRVKKVLPPGSLASLGQPPTSKVSSLTSTRPAIPPKPVPRPPIPAPRPTTSISTSQISAPPNLLSSSKLTSNKPQPRVLTSSSSSKQSTAYNLPYRERIIHLLALKPYKKPELILRLQKDGIQEKDKNSLGVVLQQVGVMNRDNSYSLARSAWADVRQDWPLYNDQDRALLKKNLHRESSSATSPAVSPASSNPDSPNTGQKRPAEELENSVVSASKKKRISHIGGRNVPNGGLKSDQATESSPDSNRENRFCSDPTEYMTNFGEIENSEQRQRYKAEFNREYAEYRTLHQEVDTVANKFQSLKSKINQTEEGTPDFEVLRKKVLDEYEAQKSDSMFMEKKRRMEYLHQKLGHIKQQISKFDQRKQQPIKVS